MGDEATDSGVADLGAAELDAMRRSRERGRADPHRPRYHLTAPNGWLNDPNGVIHWRGRYHLFYQHNPREARWGPPHWGHVVSDDMVRWQDRPVALTPEMRPVDDGGCWSGCAVDDGGTPTFVYTGVKAGEQTTCLAFGDDTLTRWRKFEGNPVQGTPGDLGITQASYRDPYVWREGDSWYQVVGVSIGDRGQVLLYRSDDLRRWEYLNPLIAPEIRDRFESDAHSWECPNFFPLGDKHVLIVSLATPRALVYPIAMIGDYRDHRFEPERIVRVDWGFHAFYAPLTIRDAGGRRLIWGWLQEQRHGDAQLAAGWSGAMSLPRELELDPRGHLRTRFVPELATLRGDAVELDEVTVAGERPLPGLDGHALELRLDLLRGDAESGGVTLHHGPDDATRIVLDWTTGALAVHRPGVTLDGALAWDKQEGRLDRPGERVTLHLFLDHSTLELIADDEVSLSTRIYPEAPGEGEVELFSEGGTMRARGQGWKLEGIW